MGEQAIREALERLIAAAPDLAAEVEQCAVELAEAALVLEGKGLPSLGRLYQAAADRARAALSKALGQDGSAS